MAVIARDSTLTTFHPDSATARPSTRLASIDIARGIVMILMAIDHVRVYAGVPAGGPSTGVFFTRWVTHFSAPAFAFLAGVAAFLHERKLNDKAALARYLVTRGALLVLFELTFLRLAWTFNLDFANYNLAGVLWMLGWCMILMAALVWMPVPAVAVVGIALVVGQQIFEPIGRALPSEIGKFLYLGGEVHVGANGPPIDILYVIVPWIGVMAAGYAFGAIMTLEAERRRALCLRLGLVLTAGFIVIAGVLVARQPDRPNAPPALFRMLNQRKYPASVLFLMMTLGPTIAFLPFAERMRGRAAAFLSTFGQVPMFFYLLHIPTIHLAALVVSLIRQGHVDPWLFGNHPLAPPPAPPGYRWSLGLLYIVFAIVIAALYRPCRWYGNLKRQKRGGVLRYV
jgi:uncharacterized membrane protein